MSPTLRRARIVDGFASMGTVAELVEWNFPTWSSSWERLCAPAGEAGLGGTAASHTAVAPGGRGSSHTPALPRGAAEPGPVEQLEIAPC